MTVALVLGFGGAAFMAVFRLLAWHRAKREVAAGYTTTFKQRGVPRVDPRSGLVLYGADDPDPESAEWRVMKQRPVNIGGQSEKRESVEDTDNHDRHRAPGSRLGAHRPGVAVNSTKSDSRYFCMPLIRGTSESAWSKATLCFVPIPSAGIVTGLANRASGDVHAMWTAIVLTFGGLALVLVLACMAKLRGRKEASAGYTTVFKRRGLPRVDPRTGLVLYGAEEPDPDGAEWRRIQKRARAYRETPAERKRRTRCREDDRM